MLTIPTDDDELVAWTRQCIDDCMGSAEERGGLYEKAAQYFYQGSSSTNAAIQNLTGPFIDRLAGFVYSPVDVRFSMIFDAAEQDTSILERGMEASKLLSREYRLADADLTFGFAVTWGYALGCYLLKHIPHDKSFQVFPVHPQNFGVLSETIISLEDQEAFCHITYPTVTRLNADLKDHPRRKEIISRVLDDAPRGREEQEEPTYFHQMIVGGLTPLGNPEGAVPQAAGVVNVFPMPTPWRPQRVSRRTIRHCELWVKDEQRDGDYTTIQMIYPDIIIEPEHARQNLSRMSGHHPFVKVQPEPTAGYFWGRSRIADVQMLQDIYNQRMRDLADMWKRAASPNIQFTGFQGVTDETYMKLVQEGGFVYDPNPGAKASSIFQPPPPEFYEEIANLKKSFDEVSGFTPVLSGQGEAGVRAGVHAQTLVRTSSPRIIDQAANVERQLADSGYLAFRLMQAQDGDIQFTPSGESFLLKQLPDDFQIEVDSHSASPAFHEDNRQTAMVLAQSGAIDAEDLIRLLHPPNADLLTARLRQRRAAAAAQGNVEPLRAPQRPGPRQGRQ